jgi:hypothetical protein
MIMYSFLSSSTIEVGNMVMFAKRSHETWTPIERSFASQSTTRLMQICNEMQGMNKLDQTVHFYYEKLKSLSETSLPSLGEGIQLLCSL